LGLTRLTEKVRQVKKMARLGGTKGWLVLSSVAVLMTLAVVPALAGAASAPPAPLTAANSPSNQWAYGGMGYSNESLIIGNEKLTWNASFGWTVIFTETNTSATTVEIEEQRTVGVDLTATYSDPTVQATYTYHGQEVDTAFANLTNASTVYVNGSPVAALGIDNDSTSIAGAIAESISVTKGGTTNSASLDVTGTAHTSAQFTPSLGLVPLNLTGVTMWNSTSTINPSGSWNITWVWANNGFNGQTGSGTRYSNGTVGTPGTVNLTGYDVTKTYGVPMFRDHVQRHAIVLVVQGPLGNYDLFVLVPHDFDLFGGEAHAYDANALGSASISAETLYVSSGPRGPEVTAGSTTFGADTSAMSTLGAPSTGSTPAAGAAPGTTVVGAPMTVAQAQDENNQLTGGHSAAASPILSTGVLLVVAGLAVVAVVGVVAVVEWRSYARRRSGQNQVGGSWPGGIPPAASAPGPQGPSASGPTAPEDPNRRL
jgi:hypothetical protein